MKKITFFLSGGFVLLAIMALTSFTTLPPGPSANGQGSITRPGEQQRRFSFHANTMPNGDVTGSGVLTLTGGTAQIKFSITCLSIDGNTAIMAGKVTSVSGNTPFQEGWDCWFKVVDHGEGSNAGPDEMTLLSGSPGVLDCTIQVIANNPLNVIEGGNIQVKP